MDKLVRSIKFPFSFDTKKLKDDFRKVVNFDWVDHYNKSDYNGKWASIALLSKNGNYDAINALTSNEPLLPTEVLQSCAYFNEILNSFLFEKTAVRLMQLDPGAIIKPHTDHCLGYEDGSFRLHIPVITNAGVEFILDGNRLIMNEGECWYIDANFTHSVANYGTESRIHLVIDGIRNEWTDTMFYKEAESERFVKPQKVLSPEEKELIIAELLRMNTPAAIAIMKEMEN